MGVIVSEMESLDPSEWDFRGLNPAHFPVALKYEAERESPQLTEALKLLTDERRTEIDRLTKADWNTYQRKPWWRRDGSWVPKDRFYSFVSIFYCCWFCNAFPKAWMVLTKEQQDKAAVRCGGERPPLRVLSRKEYARMELSEKTLYDALKQEPPPQNERRIRHYIIEIDWEHGDDAQLRPLLLQLLKLRPLGIRPRKRHTGKKAASPAYKFRQIAAWRLATKARLNFKAAQALISEHKKEHPKSDPDDLLPCYASAGAWKDAVDAGARIVRHGI